jgi:hypothetical protein
VTIYAKRINASQRKWLMRYESLTGFEPMYQDDIDSGSMTFREAARANVNWYEDHTNDMHLRIQDPIKGAPTHREF